MAEKELVVTEQKEQPEKNPAISVIIPIYNVKKYLADCIDSVLDQTFQDFEIILVNDGSTDASKYIASKYDKRYDKIRLINQENQGLSAARNTGLEAARGDYIYFLDSDDMIHPQTLEIAHTTARKYSVPLVTFDLVEEKVPGTLTLEGARNFNIDALPVVVTNEPLNHFSEKMCPRIWNSACLKLIHKDIFRDLNFVPGILYEDLVFSSMMLKYSPKTAILQAPLYYYRSNPKSIMHHDFTERQLRAFWTDLNIIHEEYKDPLYKKGREHMVSTVVPNTLEYVINGLKNTSEEKREELIPIYRSMLADLLKKGMIQYWGGIKDGRSWDRLADLRRGGDPERIASQGCMSDVDVELIRMSRLSRDRS